MQKISIDALICEDKQNTRSANDDSSDDVDDGSSDEDGDDDATPPASGQHFVIDEQIDQMDTDT